MRRLALVAAFLASALVGAAASSTGSTWAAFSDTSSNPNNTFTAAASFGSCTAGTATVASPERDTFILEGDPNVNKGVETNLVVESKVLQNQRVLVAFALPAIPAGCTVTSATLSLRDKSPAGGRTIEALRATSAWTETGATWNTQPTFTTTDVATSVTPSSDSVQTWTVTAIVQAMYAGTNHGFVLKDQTEGHLSGFAQQYPSREDTAFDPALTVDWG